MTDVFVLAPIPPEDKEVVARIMSSASTALGAGSYISSATEGVYAYAQLTPDRTHIVDLGIICGTEDGDILVPLIPFMEVIEHAEN